MRSFCKLLARWSRLHALKQERHARDEAERIPRSLQRFAARVMRLTERVMTAPEKVAAWKARCFFFDRGNSAFNPLEQLEQRLLMAGDPNRLDDYAIYGGSLVDVDKDSQIHVGLIGGNGNVTIDKTNPLEGLYGGGNLTLDKDAEVAGDIAFDGNVNLKRDVSVGGGVTAGGSVSTAKGVSVAGGILRDVPDPWADLVVPAATAFTTTPANDVSVNGSRTLAAGSYGNLNISGGSTLTLSTGVYRFDAISAGNDATLRLDPEASDANGKLEVYVAGDASFLNRLSVEKLSGDASDVRWEVHGDFTLQNDGDWVGSVFAPFGSITMHKNAVLEGQLVAANTVRLHKNTRLTHTPFVAAPTDNAAPVVTLTLTNDTGVSNSDRLTADAATAGIVTDDSDLAAATLTIRSGDTVLGGPFDVLPRIDADGRLALSTADLQSLLGSPLPDGPLTYLLAARDAFGNEGEAELSFVLDTNADISLLTPAPAALVNTNVPVTGEVDPDDANRVEVQLDGGAWVPVAFAATTGAFSRDTAYALDGTADGEHVARARVFDRAGNAASVVERFFTLDTQIATPVIAAFEQDTGVSATDRITSDTRLVLSGTADAGSVVDVTEPGLGVIGTATADASGAWTLDAADTVLTDGDYAFSATATDEAGNTSGEASPFAVTVDTIAPAVAIASPAADGRFAASPTVSGTATDAVGLHELRVSVDGAEAEIVPVAADGSWSLNLGFASDGTDDGVHVLIATADDVAGNQSDPLERSFTLVTRINPPVILSISDDTGPDGSDAVTTDTTLVVSGTSDPGTTVTVSGLAADADEGTEPTVLGTTATGASGGWTLDLTATPFALGGHTLTARAADDLGNRAGSAAFDLTVVPPPAAVAFGAAETDEGAEYVLGFTVRNSEYPVLGWAVDWGDGAPAESFGPDITAATHTYADGDAAATIRVTAITAHGDLVAEPLALAIRNVAPTLILAGATDLTVGDDFVLSLSRTDPGQDTLTRWDIGWGDGSSSEATGTASEATHLYETPGTYTVTATGTDEDGTFASNTLEVTVAGTGVTLVENQNLVTSASTATGTVVVPANADHLRIDYSDLFFDEAANSADRDVNDAFELTVRGADGSTLLPTIGTPAPTGPPTGERVLPALEAQFNLSQGQDALTAPGVVHVPTGATSGSIYVDVSTLPQGEALEISARLLNNDADDTTTVTVDFLANTPGQGTFAAPAAATPALFPVAETDRSFAPVDFARLSDVTNRFDIAYGETAYDSESGRLYVATDLTLAADGLRSDAILAVHQRPGSGNRRKRFRPVGRLRRPPQPRNRGPSRWHPYLRLSTLLQQDNAGFFTGGQTLDNLLLSFGNVEAGRRFDFDLVVLGQTNAAPTFTSNPYATEQGQAYPVERVGASGSCDPHSRDRSQRQRQRQRQRFPL